MRTRASRAGPLVACLLILALPSVLHAQQATTAGPAPEEPTSPPPATTERPQATEIITVSSARLPELLPSSRVPASVQVIKGEQAETPGAATVAESLERQVGGLTLLDEQGNSYQPDLSLRGFQGTSVTGIPQGLSVFLDGIRINEPTAEELNFDLLPNEDLDRIEVIRGPSVVFGRNTLAGVVNLTTRRGKSDGALAAQVAVGSYGQQKYQLQLSGAKAPFDYYFSGVETREDGWRESSQARLSRAFGKLGYLKGGTDVTLSYQYAENRISQAGSLPPDELSEHRNSNFSPGDFFEPFLNFVTLNLRQDLGRGFSLSANGFGRRLSLEQFNVSLLADNTRFQSDAISAGGALQLSTNALLFAHTNVLIAGLDYSHSAVDATVFDEKNDRTLADCTHDAIASGADPAQACPLKELSIHVRDKQNTFAVYVQDNFEIVRDALQEGDELFLTAAGRWDWIRHRIADDSPVRPGRESAAGTAVFQRLDPLVGLNYNLSRKHGLYASYSQGFRPPAFLELTCSGPAAICPGLQAGAAPDPVLKPVRTINYEVGGWTRPVPWLEGRLAVFRADVVDDIFSVAPTGTTGVFFQNVGATRRQGLELSVRAVFGQRLEVDANYALTDATFEQDVVLATPRQTADCTGSFCNEHVSAGSSFPLVPRHRANIAVEFQPESWLLLSLSGLYVGSQRLRGDEENVAAPLEGYFSLDAGVRASGGKLTASLLFTNILNAMYNTFGTFARNPKLVGDPVEPFRTPGRPFQLLGSVSYRL
jgi:iron complex outermembrane receptor protein